MSKPKLKRKIRRAKKDPIYFIEEFLGRKLTPWQKEHFRRCAIDTKGARK